LDSSAFSGASLVEIGSLYVKEAAFIDPLANFPIARKRAHFGASSLLLSTKVIFRRLTSHSLPAVFMNVSTPSSSSPVAKTASSPKERRALPATLRPLASFGGAILLGGAMLYFAPSTPVASSVEPTVPPAPFMISRSQVLTAHLAPLAPRTLRGQFQLTTDVTGRAPATGEVARQLVDVGAHVEAGDRVLEVSSGAASRPALPIERQQNQAEQEQMDVSRGQSALAQQLSIAQTQLSAAQERVAQAQQKVASTRSLVKRLLAGEQIPVAGDLSSPPPRKRARRKRERAASPENPATRDAARDEAVLSDAQSALEAARSDQDDAHSALSVAQKKADATKAALERAQSDFKAEKTTIDVMQGARSDADDATSALQTARSRADATDKTFTAKQAKEQVAENAAKQSRETARNAKSQIAATPTDAPDETATPKTDGRFLTPDRAVALAAAALAESKAATRAADRMRAKVDQYQRAVASTSQQAQSASKDLQSAQQQVLDTAPRPVFTSARAPQSGTITWVSRLAREVSAGQPVFGLSQGHSATLQFDDKSSAWKSLKVGQVLQAAIAPVIATEDTEKTQKGTERNAIYKTREGATLPKNSLSLSVNSSLSSVAMPATPPPNVGVFSVRLTRIEPPQGEEAAHIEAVRVEESAAPEAADAVQVELPAQAIPQNPSDAGSPATPARPVVVPTSVILPREGVNYVAVMMPTKAAPSSSVSTSPQTCTISWRPVQIARQTAFDVELRAGMRDGEEVVDQPALLLSQWKPEDHKPLLVSLDAKD